MDIQKLVDAVILELYRRLSIKAFPETPSKADLRQKSLIVEADVYKAWKNGESAIVIKKNCIITPLAKDFMKSHQIVVDRE